VPEECRPAPAEAKLMAKARDGWQHFERLMRASSIRGGIRFVLFCAASPCFGCGATGLDWVGEAHLESAQLQRVNAVAPMNSVALPSHLIPATAEHHSIEPRPRLNRTVTLGEIDVVATQVGAGPVPLVSPTVNVYNYNQLNVAAPAFGPANYGYLRSPPGFSPGRATPAPSRSNATSPLPGQNWPAVADHGPSFPYLTSPAPGWTRSE
jgi:hypothetical protein